jgi:hypothetical protein
LGCVLQARKAYDKVEQQAMVAKVAFEKMETNDATSRKKVRPHVFALTDHPPEKAACHMQVEAARRDYATKAQGREDAERQLREVTLASPPPPVAPWPRHAVLLCGNERAIGLVWLTHAFACVPGGRTWTSSIESAQ